MFFLLFIFGHFFIFDLFSIINYYFNCTMTNAMNKMSDNEQILSTNKQLKDRLQEVKLLVKASIEKYSQRFNNKNNPHNEENQEKDGFKEVIAFKETVDHYKEIITDLQAKLEMGYSNRKLQAQENELTNYKSRLELMRNENKSLRIIKKRQAKGIIDFENKYNNKVERIVLTEKQKNLKQECKIIKDYNENQVLTLKKQQNDINAVLAHCELIKANIQRKKRLNGIDDDKKDQPFLITSLNHQAVQVEINAKNEEMHYISQIKQQKDKRNRLDEDIAIIKIQIKQREQEIRISELKCKELKRLKYHSRILNTQLNNSKNNTMTKVTTSNRSFSLMNDPKSRRLLNKDKSSKTIRNNKLSEVESNENEKSRVMYEIETLSK